jgi:hypothetical protein
MKCYSLHELLGNLSKCDFISFSWDRSKSFDISFGEYSSNVDIIGYSYEHKLY